MTNLWQTLAAVLVLEGALWTLFPGWMRQMAKRAADADEGTLRYGGLVFAVAGVTAVWLLRG